jgi:exopolysaccharide biosynthesis WecB/TagA/CpsF family protein
VTNAPVLTDRRRALRSVTLGGQRVDLLRHDQLESAMETALDGDRAPLLLASANLDHVYRFDDDADLFDSSDAGQWLVLLDGMPLVWACKKVTGTTWDKLAGSDLLPDLLTLAERRGERVGFLGGGEDLRAPLATALRRGWPSLEVSGHWTPAREVVQDASASAAVAREIRAAGTDILVVGLGKPRQEEWMAAHGVATGARVLGAFGASAEFVAGTQRRAPRAVARVGAEWLFRLVRDPRRLARRYLAEGPVALAKVAKDVRSAA